MLMKMESRKQVVLPGYQALTQHNILYLRIPPLLSL